MNILLVLFCMYGICFTFQYTKLLNKPRNWLRSKVVFIDSLLECSFCTGAWSGLITYFLFYNTIEWRKIVIYFFVGAVWCYFLDLIIDNLELNKEKF